MNRNDDDKLCLAIDYGGTKLAIGLVKENGDILLQKNYPTGCRTLQDAAALLFKRIDEFVLGLEEKALRLSVVGMGLVGRINPFRGEWQMLYEQTDTAVPVSEQIRQKYGLSCFLDNDVKAAALAEKTFGYANSDDFIYVNIGTGIAAGIISGGNLLRGKNNDAGEIGHLVVAPDHEMKCFCGKKGCVEILASGYGLKQRCGVLLKSYPESVLAGDIKTGILNTRILFEAADNGDALAKKAAFEATEAIILLLGNLEAVFDPEKIILGGGVISDGWIMRELEKRKMTEKRYMGINITEQSKINPVNHGLLGGAIMGFNGIHRKE
jgi:predicted NBD/HSP70 family sugar kinase